MECGNDQCSAASTLRLSVAVWVGTVGAFPDLTVSSKTKIDQCTHVQEGSRLCENVLEPRMRRIAFSISFSRQSWKVQLVFTSTKSRRNFYTQVERQSFHTAWVKNGSLPVLAACPFYPQEQTPSGRPGMSVSCQYATSSQYFEMKKAAD